MKKFVFCLLALAMTMFVLAGCGADNEGNKDAKSSADSGTMTIEDGVLTMGTNAAFPPYEFYEGDKIVGIDAEIAERIAEKLGLELKIVDMDFEALVASVQSGKIDMSMAGMTVNEERLKNVDFSDSYATGIQVVIVKEDSPIKTVEDLNNTDYLIGAQSGTTGYIYASDSVENGGYGEDRVTPYSNGATAVKALVEGKVDCVIIDNEPAKSFVAENKGLKLLDTQYVVEDYAIALPKDNAELKDAVNKALQELIADGTVQTILDKYINAD